jgi:hypothetical protein
VIPERTSAASAARVVEAGGNAGPKRRDCAGLHIRRLVNACIRDASAERRADSQGCTLWRFVGAEHAVSNRDVVEARSSHRATAPCADLERRARPVDLVKRAAERAFASWVSVASRVSDRALIVGRWKDRRSHAIDPAASASRCSALSHKTMGGEGQGSHRGGAHLIQPE